MKEEQIKPIEEEPVKKEVPKKETTKPKKIITKLPEWSIEPSLEFKRGK